MATSNTFDFEIDIHGARVVARQPSLGPACKSDGAIDTEIQRLKDDLDAVAARMKSAIKRQSGEPVVVAG